MRNVLPPYGIFIILIAVCYYFYNDRMFVYINLMMNKKISVFKSRILTFIINYEVFMLISRMQFYLIVNWTIFAVFLIFEIAVLYRCPFKVSLFCGIQGALVGLAINFITRSGAALLLNLPLLTFDSRMNSFMINLKRYPIGLGFLLAGFAFWWMQRHFANWSDTQENPDNPANLTFSLYLVLALFIYLDLNLLIYFVFSNQTVIKLWGMKSGFCAIIGYYIGASHIYTLNRLQKFERRTYEVREELHACRLRENELSHIAYSDSLTGCCSRAAGVQAIREKLQAGQNICLCFLDINDLKPVNDKLGHDTGDRYLSAVSYALMNVAGEADVICRYGGDEFLVITPLENAEKLKSGMKNLQWALQELSNTSEYPFKLWVSYGFASSLEAPDIEALIKLADERMYENKKREKGQSQPSHSLTSQG